MSKSYHLRDYTQMALLAALYVAVTLVLAPISFGAIQFRVSELLNFLAFYQRKYLYAVTLGCMIANSYNYGVLDMVVGGLSTLVFGYLGVKLFSRYLGQKIWLFDKAYFYFSFFFAASMVTIALELYILFQMPFLLTWGTLFLGELASLLLGSLVIDQLASRFDFRS